MATAKAGLVREYLEKVSGDLFELPYRPLIRDMIRGHAGIYALYKADKLYYVGLAKNLMSRVKQHSRDRHQRKWDRFSVYLTHDSDAIKALESLLLRVIYPKGNRVQGKIPHAVDQVKALQRAMTAADANRRATLLGGKLAVHRVKRLAAKSKGTTGLKGALERRIPLKGTYKRRTYRATMKKNGEVSYARESFSSPSGAARKVIGRAVNGWQFWHYRAGGEWVPLARIR